MESRRNLTFITGPLGSGKTRFAEALAAALPADSVLDLHRMLAEPIAPAVERLSARVLEGWGPMARCPPRR